MRSLVALKKYEKYTFLEILNIKKNMECAKKISEQLSETDILDLEDKFLTHGFHYINVKDIAAGRRLVDKFLDSLQCYTQNAALTISNGSLELCVTDIYYELFKGGYVDSTYNFDFDGFFIHHFYYDFMWIEASNELVESQWFADFFQKMVSFKIDQQIPVLIISYQYPYN